MVPGLMQAAPLSTTMILRYAAEAHGSREIVARMPEGGIWRYDYAGLAERCGRLAQALTRMGLMSGDRVASLAWNTHRHLEMFYAVPGLGAVLTTVNPRFHPDQIAYVLNHSGARVLFLDRNLLEVARAIAPRLTGVEAYVLLDGGQAEDRDIEAFAYEDLIAAEAGGFDWPALDENSGAVLCYTSGTTGEPKGVLYSHRSIVLHAMAGGLNGAFGFKASDVVMPCSSLYHATAWGLPYMAPINGAKLVLPADRFDPAGLHELIEAEGVTFTGGVPTIWTLYLAYLQERGLGPGKLDRLVIAGSAVPRAMAEAFRRHGVETIQLWGMTETSPLGVTATPTPMIDALGADERDEVLWTRQGRLQFGVELKVIGEDGQEAPRDGATSGALMVRGPWVLQRYFRGEQDVVDTDGWFDTGDIATLDEAGFMRITDRTKDVIKSGGEWISSIDLENIAVACPGVRVAAVVGVFHPKWEERPILVIETHEGQAVSREDVLAYLEPRIAKWWTPDDVIFAAVPLTATGKIDKKRLRETYRDHLGTVG